MFIGHFGVAFAAKKFAPKTSLGAMFAAAEFLDLLWPVLVLAGVEHVSIAPGITKMTPLDFYDYPISHSLFMVCVWAAVCATLYWMIRRYARGAIVVCALVVSHWFLDVAVHRPDLPVAPWGHRVFGFGLWNHTATAIVLELILFLGGLFLYANSTTAKDRTGSIALWALVIFLLVTWCSNIFGPPPPSVKAIGMVGVIGGALFVAWGGWIDRHRTRKNRVQDHDEFFTEKRVAI